jgi:predicted Zn-dependent protease
MLLAVAVVILMSCAEAIRTISEVGTEVGVQTGAITEEQAQSIRKTTPAVAKSFEDITPEQEYYIGRTVGATITAKYRPYGNEKANHYLNVLGQTLAQASDRPETFGGYHFLVLDSEEINAFAAPGGLIFVSRGMLLCCNSEDAVAAVLAHEIGHIQYQHGLRTIKTGRLTSALTIMATETAKNLGDQELTQLTKDFEGSVNDIVTTMVTKGYSRAAEHQADAAAVTIMERVGYRPTALTEMLREMEKRLKPGGHDFAQTHPTPESRIEDVNQLIGNYQPAPVPPIRQARFEDALGAI